MNTKPTYEQLEKRVQKLEARVEAYEKTMDRLKTNERRSRLLIENMPSVSWITDKQGRTIFISPNVKEIYGFSQREIYEKGDALWFGRIHPEDVHAVKESFDHLFAKEQKFDVEYRIQRKDGKWIWIHDKGIVPLEKDGAAYAYGVFTDITVQRRVSEMQAAQLRLIDYASDHSAMELLQKFLDEAEAITDSKIGFYHFVEQDQQTLSIQTWSTNTLKGCSTGGPDLNYPIEKAGVWVDSVREGKPVIHNDYDGLPHKKGLPDGHVPVMRELVVPVFREGKIVAALGVGNKESDYTAQDVELIQQFADLAWETVDKKRNEEARRLSEKALQENEYRLNALFNHRFQLTALLDRDGIVLMINETACNMVGKDCGELIGKYFWELPHWSHDESLQAKVREGVRQVRQGHDISFEGVHPDAEGENHYIDFSMMPVKDEDGNVIFMVPEGHDITERKRNEKEQMTLERQLQQVQKLEAIGTLAGGIAHDFNNILTAIIWYAELALDDITEIEAVEYAIDQIITSCSRATDLVKQILLYSRQSAEDVKPVKMMPILKEAVRLLRATLPSTIDIETHYPVDSDMVLSDPIKMHQIVMNLCTNAAHAMEATGGTLTIRLDRIKFDGDSPGAFNDLKPGYYLKLEVADTGHGIPLKVMDNIFDPFFSTKARDKGTGLGLSVVHGIVKSHGGSVQVSSELGTGTVFSVYLPVVASEEKADAVEDAAVNGGTERILFVDDEPSIVLLGKKLLERMGYRVTAESDSLRALDTFRRGPDQFDLVITDKTMPRMTGLELAAKMIALRPDVPVILCTGFGDEIALEEAQAIGIETTLNKPINRKAMLQTVRKVLDRAEFFKKG